MKTTSELIKKYKKESGDTAVEIGVSLEEADRIPTGIFHFDLASGGGFPIGKMSLVYGHESSGKTNLALLAIASAQRLYPDKRAVFIDAEFSLDGKWSKRLGVDIDKLIHVKPPYAEKAVDMFDGFLRAEDVSIVVVDSLAALATTNEIESETQKVAVGGASILINKMIRKMNMAIGTRTQAPAVILINQIRYKVGVLFGNPETLPGGNGQHFHTSLKVKITSKAKVDKKVNPLIPTYKETKGAIVKFKVPIVAQSFEYDLYTTEANGFRPGECDDWKVVLKYLQEMDFIKQIKPKGYGLAMEGHKKKFKTYADMRTYIYGKKAIEQDVKKKLLNRMVHKMLVEDKVIETL